jgi:hypothetical protein
MLAGRFLIGLTMLAMTDTADAQAVSQADVRVRSFAVVKSSKLPFVFEVKVAVYSENDDDARDTKLLVFLPPETDALALPQRCQPTSDKRGYVTCSLGVLGLGATETVSFTIGATPSHVLPRLAAVAYSQTADPRFVDNHAERIEDGTVVHEKDQPSIYVIFGGAKFLIADPGALERAFGGRANLRQADFGALARYGGVPEDGTILREDGASAIWLIEQGKRRLISSPSVLAQHGGPLVVGLVPAGALSKLAIGLPL